MNLFGIAMFFFIATIIYSVLMRLAEKKGRSTAQTKTFAALIALTWPFWGEFAVVAAAAYLIFSIFKARPSYAAADR